MLSGQKLPGYRFSLAVIGYAVWLYHRFTLSYRDVEELLLERGIAVTRESIRTWCIKFSDLFAQGLRPREPRRGSWGHLDEMCVDVGGVKHWLWRAVDEHGAVLDVFLQEHRDTEAARSFFHRLLGEYDEPEVIHTDKLWSYGAALRELPVLHRVEHVQGLCCLNRAEVVCPAVTEPKPYRHRFPMTIIQHAVWLYHRFPLSYRDVQELLYQRGIQVSHETLREWYIKFGSLFADELRYRKPQRGSRW
ncbi:hypothetical protein DESA109040_17990 [Deinococcus saxicola]